MSSLTDEIKELVQSTNRLESHKKVDSQGIKIEEINEEKLALLKKWFKVPRKTQSTVRISQLRTFDLFDVPIRGRPIKRGKKSGIKKDNKLKECVIEMNEQEKQRLRDQEDLDIRKTRSRSSVSPRKSFKKVADVSSEEESSEEESAFEVSDDDDIEFKPVRIPKVNTDSPKKRGRKPKDQSSLESEYMDIDNDNDDNENEGETNFMFLNKTTLSPTKKSIKGIRSSKAKFVIISDAFQSPKKQKEGLLLLSQTPSPNKRGYFSSPLNRTPSSSGRNGSPRKKARIELQDQSARKRANRTIYSKLMDDGIDGNDNDDDDDDYQENIDIAERIIIDSKNDGYNNNNNRSKLSTPKKQLKPFDLPIYNPNFIPTPLPTKDSTEKFFEGKYNDTALFLDGPEGYFEQHSTLIKPSHNSMAQAKSLDYDEFNSFVLFSGFMHLKQKQKLIKNYEELFHQYLFELKEGFNLLFYGVGSKRNLLLKFVKDYLLDFIDVPVIVINGYNPAVKFNEILMEICKQLELNKKLPRRTNECVDYLVDYYKNKPITSKLIILINNIDGESFREEKIQGYLSKIGSIKQFHLISSMDHINGPLLWDSLRLSNLNFIWHNVPTYEDYITEISFKDPLTLGQSAKTSSSNGAKYVLSSLTISSKKLYKILAKKQLENMKELSKTITNSSNVLKGGIKFGIEFTILFRLCVEEFITSNVVNFRTMLMEFVEHKMANLTRDNAGTEIVFVPYSYDELSQLVQNELE